MISILQWQPLEFNWEGIIQISSGINLFVAHNRSRKRISSQICSKWSEFYDEDQAKCWYINSCHVVISMRVQRLFVKCYIRRIMNKISNWLEWLMQIPRNRQEINLGILREGVWQPIFIIHAFKIACVSWLECRPRSKLVPVWLCD